MLPTTLTLAPTTGLDDLLSLLLTADALVVAGSISRHAGTITVETPSGEHTYCLLNEINRQQYEQWPHGPLAQPITVTYPTEPGRRPITLDCRLRDRSERECELATESLTRNVGLFWWQLVGETT